MRDIIFKIINKFTEGVDTYHNNGSMWLIFTDEKKWVIELTKEGTLWYNYYFFQDCLKYVSLEVVENQHFITEWVENTIQNGVKSTEVELLNRSSCEVENTIQNGVKETGHAYYSDPSEVEDTIQNGVKETKHNTFEDGLAMEEVIQNGIKKTQYLTDNIDVEKALKNGIIQTKYCELHSLMRADHIIIDGIKKTNWRKVDNCPDYTDRITKKGVEII